MPKKVKDLQKLIQLIYLSTDESNDDAFDFTPSCIVLILRFYRPSSEASDNKEAPLSSSCDKETTPVKRVKLSSPKTSNENTAPAAVSGPQPGALSGLLAAYSSSESGSDS